MIPEWLQTFNAFAWVGANLLIGYIAVVLSIFAIAYYVLFDPRATTAGRFIFRFVLSLIGVIGLVFVGIFLDPHRGGSGFVYPGDILWWRPTARLLVYGYVAYSVTALVVLVVVRKWWPEKLHTVQTRDLLKARSE